MLLLFRRPYRCRACRHRWRSFIWRSNEDAGDEAAPGNRSGKQILVWVVITAVVVAAFAARERQWFGAEPRPVPVGSGPAPSPQPEPAPGESLSPTAPAEPGATKRSKAARSKKVSPELPADAQVAAAEKPASKEEAAQAIRAERAPVPPELQSSITSDNVVNVRVSINETGRVTGAAVDSTSGPVAGALAPYALRAARSWHFKPARQKGKPVRSEKVVEFLFRPAEH